LVASAALGGAVKWRDASIPLWLADAIAILTFQRPEGGPAAWGWMVAGLLAHGLGLASLLGLAGLSPWLAPLALALLLAPQGMQVLRPGRGRMRLAPLAPLFLAYATSGLVWLSLALGLSPTPWEGLAFPDPWRSAFHAGGVTLAAAAWAWAAEIALVSGERAGRIGATLLLVGGLGWGGITYLSGRSHGATGSDPYAYVQMAVDLAERGTPLHRFRLFGEVTAPPAASAGTELAWHPLVPVGYNLPLNAAGDAASVWPPGFSAVLAGAYGIGGEGALYWTAPVVAWLAALATAWLVVETLKGEAAGVRWGSGALAASLVLSSPEFLDRSLVPMADGMAALGTTLSLVFALRLARGGGWRPAALAGLALGAAYTVRYTQLVLAVAVGLAAWTSRTVRESPSWKARLTLAAGAAMLVALPDVVYRWQSFGSPLATGSTELPLLGPENVGRALQATLPHLLAAGEWGYLLPLAGVGSWWLVRRHGRASLVLGSALVAVFGVHLLYAALRLRDLISVFPLLHLVAAYGGVRLLGWMGEWAGAERRLGSAVLRLTLAGGVLLALGLRSASVLARITEPGWASFGYVTAAQRSSFDKLGATVPEGGIVGASLGAGAAHLYTGRQICRPAGWNPEELETFLARMEAQQRPVYLLDDGGRMPDLIRRLGPRTVPLAALDLPRFHADGSPAGGLAMLYQVTR
jgi:hypothetical protein